MKIGIAGIGVVGGATLKSFQLHNINVKPYDKYKNIGAFDDLLDADIVFLCLPTLYNQEMQSYDKTALNEVCAGLSEKKYSGIVVVKSTVEPGTTQVFAEKYNLSMMHNPEFLTARTAFEDFHNQPHIIIGTTTSSNQQQLENITQFYKKYYSSAEYTVCSSTESEMIKIFCNCFYSVKVQFFNELYLLCQKHSVNYDNIKNTMIKNGWINPQHTSVPGPDGKLSYGGMCFPKDTNALLSHMKLMGTAHRVLEATVLEHNEMRDD